MIIAFILIVLHFIADFIFQDEEWAVNKSKNITALVKHTLTYTAVFFIGFCLFCAYQNHIGHHPPEYFGISIKILWFFLITFIAHTITDYFTSKVTSSLYSKGKFGSSIPNLGFFTMIGFDQVLHYAQLFLTYHLLTQ